MCVRRLSVHTLDLTRAGRKRSGASPAHRSGRSEDHIDKYTIADDASYEHPLAQARKDLGLPRALEHLSDAEAVEYARMLSLDSSREESDRRQREADALRDLLSDDLAAFALDEELAAPSPSTWSRRRQPPFSPDTSDSSLWPPVSPQLSASSRRSSPLAGPSRYAGAASPPPLSLSPGSGSPAGGRSWSAIAGTPPSSGLPSAAMRRPSWSSAQARETTEEADLRMAIELSLAEARSRGEDV